MAFDVPFCPTAALFGIPCPGCGMTRATLALLSGDVARAIGFHPLVFVIAPFYLAVVVGAAVSYVRGPRLGGSPRWVLGRPISIAAGIAVAALFAVWIARFAGAFGGPVPVRTLLGLFTR